MTAHSRPIEIDVGSQVWAVTFSANGDYIVSGNDKAVRLWRTEDGKAMATMNVGTVNCLAVSRDGKWIAAGTYERMIFVWDAKTYKQVLKLKHGSRGVSAVDFSPDSTRLVSTPWSGTATVWDVATGEQIQTFSDATHAVKYSPQGDQLGTVSWNSIRVRDSKNGRLVVDIQVAKTTPLYNTGLVWFDNHLLVLSADTIKEFDASTGSPVAQWQVPDSNKHSCIALPKHEQFVAHSTNNAITLWCTSTHTQLALIQHTQDIRSIAFSPDDRFLAIGGKDGKIRIQSLSCIIDSIPSSSLHVISQEPDIASNPSMSSSRLHPTLQEPDIQINDGALDSWKNDQLENADALLTATISQSHSPSHHALASRAVVRARLQQWDAALNDAEMAIDIQPSIIAFIAKSVAHVGNGDKDKGYRTCDIAFEHFHSSHVTFLLLIKAIVVFMAGEHIDAISRLDDLIATVRFNSVCYTVQAYMYHVLGCSQMQRSDYDRAIQSFQHARAQMRDDIGQPLFAISLTTGWKFDDFDITIRLRLCEALYAAGRTNDAGESLLEMVHTLDEKVYKSVPITKWVSDFIQQCLSTLGHPVPNATRHGNSRMIYTTSDTTSLLRVWAKATLVNSGWKDALVAAINFVIPKLMIYQVVCEYLETINSTMDAVECFHAMMSESGENIYVNGPMTEWICDFTQRCLSAHVDAASSANRGSNSPTFHTALPPLLREWAKAKLTCGSWKNALLSAAGFTLSRVEIYRVVCERLEMTHRISDAIECFRELTCELQQETIGLHDGHLAWALDFRQRTSENLERLGDRAVDAQRYDDAIARYSSALSLIPSPPQAILIKRSKAWLATGSWKQALEDANQVVSLDPSSPWGYNMKHAALHKGGDYDNAVHALELMLTKMAESHDSDVQQQGDQYITPSSTRAAIRKVVQRTLYCSPRVLINTTTGRLHDRAEQASAFESLPIFQELVSSMTTRINYVRIKREVRHYFQYVILSHKWEDNEPLFQQVVHMAVYDLETSPTHDKLQTFCKIVRNSRFNWAWSDTCCIDKSDHIVLQEALVAMFRWYQGSAMVIVFLRGVRSSSPYGALAGSIWNTRAWTLQEYIAAKVIRFYTEDWTLYRDLDIPNHKESPEIISEMEQATGVSAQQLMALYPGLSSIREKLRLASTRTTTWVEDAAYSLLGIFSAIGIPAIYGEGEASLGRLLANVFTRSGDVGILAWTGESSRFNSCMPARITVFNGPVTSHVPPPIPDSEMERIITGLRAPSFNLDVALMLYDRLNELPTPRFAESRMTLPCIAFQIPPFLAYHRTGSSRVYRADTIPFGMVEIRTRQDLSRMGSLYLVHPWLDALMEHEDSRGGTFAEDDALSPIPNLDDEATSDDEIVCEEIDNDSSSSLDEPHVPPLPLLMHTTPLDRETGARRLVARLRQSFGALLFTPASTRRRTMDYRRVAADGMITVRFQDNVSLADILNNVRILDVL